MKIKKPLKLKNILKIVSFTLLQTFVFTNFLFCCPDIFMSANDINDRRTLSPSIRIGETSVKGLFDQRNFSRDGLDLGQVIDVPRELFNSTFINDIAINPSIMSHAGIKQDEFKQAMFKVLKSRNTTLKNAYLNALEGFFILNNAGVVDNEIVNQLGNIIAKDGQQMETRLRAQKALAAIAIRSPEFKSQIETLVVNATNDRVAILKQRNRPFHFLVSQANESLLDMNADDVIISMLEKNHFDHIKASDYMRRILAAMVNHINKDQKAKGKAGKVGRIYTKENSFTDGLWMVGSDIDGLVIQLENISNEDMQRYEKIFDNLFMEVGVAGIKDALEKPYWKTGTSEQVANTDLNSSINLFDIRVFNDAGTDKSQWSPIKRGWGRKNKDFRTEKSKLRGLFISLINSAGNANEILDAFLVDDPTILSDSDRAKIKSIFSDTKKAAKIRELLNRMQFILGVNKVFYESFGESHMLVDDLYETLDDLRILEKIADDSGDQLISMREVSIGNGSKEFHVYPLWFMYTHGVRGNSDVGIRLVGRNTEKQTAVDKDVFILPIESDGGIADARVASLVEVKSFVGANKHALFDVENQTITLLENNSLGYSLVESNQNMRLVFFDANGDISLLAESKQEAGDFANLISKVDIFASVLDKDNMLVTQDVQTRADLIEPVRFLDLIKKQEFAQIDSRIEMVPFDEQATITPTSEELVDFVNSGKQAVFDVASGKIILYQDSSRVNGLVLGNENYRYLFFDTNGDISLFVKSLEEAQMFESILTSAKIFSQILNIDRQLIVKNIDTIMDLKEPVEFFGLIGRAALEVKTSQPSADITNIGPGKLEALTEGSMNFNAQLIDEAI